MREVDVPSDESDLREIDTKRLLAMRHELDQDMTRSAHSSATLEPNPRLRARIAEVEAEIERRASEGEGEPALHDIAARRLESDAASLPPTEPEWASSLTPEIIPTLTNGDLRIVFKKVESELELHRKTYDEASEIEAPGKINMRRTAIVSWRAKAKQIQECLAGEMLRRDLQASGPAPRPRSDRPQRRRERPETAARRAIVRTTENLSDEEICRRLDLDSIPLPGNWEGVQHWAEAYRSTPYRPRIHVILSKDRRAIGSARRRRVT